MRFAHSLTHLREVFKGSRRVKLESFAFADDKFAEPLLGKTVFKKTPRIILGLQKHVDPLSHCHLNI